MDKYTTGAVANNDLQFQNWTLLPTNDDKPANAETVRSPFRVVSDRTRYLMNETSWRRIQAIVRCEDGSNIKIEALSGAAIYDPGNDKWYLFRSPVAGPFDLTLTPGALAINTWFYLYVKQVAGAVAFELSTTAPDVMLSSKAGDVAFRYLCAVRSTGTGTIIPFRYSSGATMYLARQTTLALAGKSNVGFVAFSLGELIPPHCRSAEMNTIVQSFVGPPAFAIWRIRYPGGTPEAFTSNTGVSYVNYRAMTDASNNIEAEIDNALNVYTMTIRGFYE